jgi:hypothetical protein
MTETKRVNAKLAPEVIELAEKIGLELYGKSNYSLKSVVDYCINKQFKKLKK